ncbi:class I SAM-dependent DNA methyltransferase [Listeria ilorinensis]|uniref:class I SAM-dependent DNA methyltransferase n=1 Tax=Listeria ilorinensis TaxID=2867439 RepID=UPI001EF674E5|nr:class I SAM-dependent methyltransferase [Listeria ilorinensis]
MSYEYFPSFYDELMEEELYEEWLAFTLSLLKKTEGRVLDLGCGTGEFLLRMTLSGFETTGLDLSSEMLQVAERKFQQIDLNIPLFEQNMASFQLAEKFDVITCFCDSLNYLEKTEDVEGTFQQVYKHLEKDGQFLFDVHSVYKVDTLFHDYQYADADPAISTIWQSYKGEEPHSVEHELSFFVQDDDGRYNRKDELHKERTYPVDAYLAMLNHAGFSKIQVYADFEKVAPVATSERIFFVCEK